MFPSVAIVDPELTHSLPPDVTAVTGMDALTQAIEAYWSRNAQPISDTHALAAIRTIVANLESACSRADESSRYAMSLGSLLSGLAFCNTKTTMCHSLSYPMTAYFGVPHGQAVSITLASFLAWNASSIQTKLSPLIEALGSGSVAGAADRIRSMMSAIGLATDLRSLGLSRSDVEIVLAEGFDANRAGNNPRPVSVKDARAILHDIY